MKKVSLVFFTEDTQSSTLFRLPGQQFVPISQCYSFSSLLSIAGYMVWKFPYLPAPGVNKQVSPKYREETFPDRLALTHEMFNEWVQLFEQSLIKRDALRRKETLYLRVRISSEYSEKLLQNGFESEQISHLLTWNDIEQTLDEQNLLRNKKNRNVLILSCTAAKKKLVSYHASATISGIFYNNENWKVFYIMLDQFPTQQELDTASNIIVPGSQYNLTQLKSSQLVKLIENLKVTLQANRQVKYMGICFGHQLLSQVHNPQSVKRTGGCRGLNTVKRAKEQALQKYEFLKNFQKHNITKIHIEQVASLPQGFIKAAESDRGCVEVMVSNDGRMLGFQGHPQLSLLRYNSLESLRKMHKQNFGQSEMLSMMDKEKYGSDETLSVQQICRQFLGLE